MNESNFIPLRSYREYPLQEMKDRAQAFREDMQRRRTIRTFSNRPIPPHARSSRSASALRGQLPMVPICNHGTLWWSVTRM